LGIGAANAGAAPTTNPTTTISDAANQRRDPPRHPTEGTAISDVTCLTRKLLRDNGSGQMGRPSQARRPDTRIAEYRARKPARQRGKSLNVGLRDSRQP
jgi:hypothetical protein